MRSLLNALMLVLSCSLLPIAHCRAQSVDLRQTSLALAPKDAAFFECILEPKEMLAELLQSDCVQKLRSTPYMQKLLAAIEKEWQSEDGQLKPVKQALRDRLVQSLLETAKDMVSNEVFLFGDSEWSDFLRGFFELNAAMNDALQGDEGPDFDFLMEDLPVYLRELKVPRTVVGFKVRNVEAVKSQVYALEALLRYAVGQIPEAQPILKRLKSVEKDGTLLLYLPLDMSLIPLDSIEEPVREFLDRLVEEFGDRAITLCVAVKQNYLMATIGEGAPFVAKLGTGESLLDHERLKVLLNAASTGLRGVTFESGEWRAEVNYGGSVEAAANQFADTLSVEYPESPEIEQWSEDLVEDAVAIDGIVQSMTPDFDARVSWSLSSAGVWEGYGYDWTQNLLLENASPLSILDYVGKGALLAVATKQKPQPALAELFKLLVARGPRHVRMLVDVMEESDAERERVVEIIDRLEPILVELANVIFDQILPSMDERQSLFVVASQWKVSELPAMPTPPKALPMPELAIVFKLQHRDQFLTGCRQLYELFDALVEVIRDVQPDAIPPEYSVPRPNQETTANGDEFSYPQLAGHLGIDGFLPKVIVNKDVVAVGYSQRQMQDIFQKPTATKDDAFFQLTQPKAMVGWVDLTEVITSIEPWIEYGLTSREWPAEGLEFADTPAPQKEDVLAMWNCLQSAGRIAFKSEIDNSGVTISHWRWSK